MLVQFGSQTLVSEIRVHIDEITVFIDSSTKLVVQEALLISLEIFHDFFSSLWITIEIPTDIMSIEIISLEIEGWW